MSAKDARMTMNAADEFRACYKIGHAAEARAKVEQLDQRGSHLTHGAPPSVEVMPTHSSGRAIKSRCASIPGTAGKGSSPRLRSTFP
ncbi:hypothetical protein [Burkholderia sp. S-53]|uniref:hypothetical protein n=1 Tax=Burkholderia sp. S-53 TaxID=2906514 RepID=UPI0021CF98C0|nr:hypothetical protein [Burkholderia sp. S-53]UXU85753.1 hypothetical protein LXM88_00170 [Burkholderia sp. S-53]